jgi:pimeloyl-ACP methyl ester carboxylesterase
MGARTLRATKKTGAPTMDIDWSGHSVETDELRINYARAGSGHPVIFLHGWPEFNRTWLHAMPVLAERFDCIAPDLRGFGRTVSKVPRTLDGTPVDKLAKDLLDFADTLGLKRFAIVSHDVGSFVAQQAAIAAPDRISALFFFNCTYPGIGKRWGDYSHFRETWYQQFNQKDFAAALVGSSREACRIYFRHFLTHWSHQKHAFDAHLEEWVDNFLRPGNLQGGFDWYIGISKMRALVAAGAIPPAPPITTPTYFYWGAHDPVLRFDFSDKLGDYFTNFTLEKAEDAGHFAHFERPQQANERILRFLGAHAK